MNRRIVTWGALALLLALYCLVVWLDLLPWLRGWGTVFEGGWTRAFAFVPLVILAPGTLSFAGVPLMPPPAHPVGAPLVGALSPDPDAGDKQTGHPRGVPLRPPASGTPRNTAPWLLGLSVGITIPLAAVALITNLDLPYVYTYNMRKLAEDDALRPCWPWVLYGPLDFLQFLGLPLALATAASLLISSKHRPSSLSSVVNPYAAVLWLLLLVHDLTGNSRGELGRTLVFLMPLALASVYWWAYNTRPNPRLIAALFFAQAVVCAVIGARWFVP